VLRRTVRAALKVLTPPPELTISDWADANRRLSSEASAEPGRWRTSRAEYQRGIMDAISDARVETVVVMSSSQTGKTEAQLCAVGYHIDRDPAPIMVVMPTERDAETWSKDRFSPMARDTPCLVGRIADPKSRDGTNKILHKRFPGGHLTIVGANAPSGLASRPIRLLFCDEVDRYPFSAGAEGDPVNLAKKRTVTFWNRKIVLVSTPTIRGASRIETAYAESDQRQFRVPCPACGTEQVLIWGQVTWDKAPDGSHRPETARYACIDCNAAWTDEVRWAAVSKGRWVATRPSAGIAGFHLNEIYSPWVRLEAMVRGFLSAKAGGDEAMKTFVNTSLGETWMETGEAPDWQRLADRRESWSPGTVPERGLFLTAERRRAEGPDRGRRLGLGPGPRKLARRPPRARGRPRRSGLLAAADGSARADMGARLGSADGARPARDRLRVRDQRGLCLVAPGGLRAGGAGEGRRGVHPNEPGDRADLCRRDRRGQAAPARGPALDRGHLDLQGRDLSLPAAG
jgi:phage terminase large subunit GpA-like protein